MELKFRHIQYRHKANLNPLCKGRELRERYIPDLSVFGEVVVELKTLSALASKQESQLMKLMRISHKSIEQMIRFGLWGSFEETNPDLRVPPFQLAQGSAYQRFQ